jgi:hypothetical protein
MNVFGQAVIVTDEQIADLRRRLARLRGDDVSDVNQVSTERGPTHGTRTPQAGYVLRDDGCLRKNLTQSWRVPGGNFALTGRSTSIRREQERRAGRMSQPGKTKL